MAQRERPAPAEARPPRRPLPLWLLVVGACCSSAALVIAVVTGSPWYAILTAAGTIVLWLWVFAMRARRPRVPGPQG